MKKMIIDINNFPISFYDTDVHSNIPEGTIDITHEQWSEFLDNPGKRIWNNGVIEVYNEPENLSDTKTIFKRVIDDNAYTVRIKYVTANQDDIYREKYDQAVEFAAAGYPVDASPYPFVVAEANATSTSNQTAADSIIAARQQWMTKMVAIEEARRSGKVNIDAAVDVAGVEAARDAAIAALQLI